MAMPDHDAAVLTDEDVPPGAIAREGTYGERVVAVEPGGAEFIPLHERHGKPLQLFWTWSSPNMEFATIFVGVLAVAAFGLNFWQAVLGIIVGTVIGSVTQGLLSQQGPVYGVPQMVLSRLGFGYWGNVLPAGLNAVTAGVGWFAVNSVSGAFALNALTHLPKAACLVIIVIAAGRGRVLRPQPGARVRALRVPDPDDHLPDRRRGHPVQGAPRPGQPRRQHRRLPAHGGRVVRLRGRLESLRLRLHPLPAAVVEQARHRAVGRAWPVPVLRAAGDRRRGRRDRGQPGRGARQQPDRRLHRPDGHPAGRPDAAGDRAGRGVRERAQHLLRRAVVHRARHQAAASAAARDRGPGVRRDRLRRSR